MKLANFLLAIWELDPAQNLEKYKKWLYVLIQLTNRNMKFMHSLGNKTKDVQGQRPSNITLSLIFCFFEVCRDS